MSDSTFSKRFLYHCVVALQPLKDAMEDSHALDKLFKDLGWDVSSTLSSFSAIDGALDAIYTALGALSGDPSESDILAIIDDVGTLYTTITGLTTSSAPSPLTGSDATTFINDLPNDLFELLITRYLSEQQPDIYSYLQFLKIVEKTYVVPASGSARSSYFRQKINYNNILQVVTNPVGLVKSATNWNTSNFTFDFLSDLLMNYLSAIDLTSVLYRPTQYANTYRSIFSNTDTIDGGVAVNIATPLIGSSFVPIQARIIESKGSTFSNSGFMLHVGVPAGTTLTQQITTDLSIIINDLSVIGDGLVFSIKPNALQFKYLNNPATALPVTGLGARFKYAPDAPTLLFGKPDGTRLELKGAEVGFKTKQTGSETELIIDADLSGLVLKMDPSNSDGFINKLFGNTKEINIPLVIRWSSITGISFMNSSAFEITVNTNFTIGNVHIDDVIISIKAPSGSNSVIATVGANISGLWGPVAYTVSNIGITSNIHTNGGNVGPFGIDLGFKPPNGVGIVVDNANVKGGGYLYINSEKGIYKGHVQLEVIEQFGIVGVGIITTKNPDGTPGYSMFAMLSATFRPGIPLGFGFTLSGLGAMLGINRDMNQKAIMEGVRSKAIDNVLFPEKVEERISSIITDLETFFPTAQNRYVLGLLARIDWGDPNNPQLVINLALVLNFPKPVRLAIMGTLKVGLPDVNNPLTTINATFAGLIDFDKKYMLFDARIHDSKIMTFNLVGDICMRLFWGDRKEFLLSSGGFHPSYQVPAFMQVPKMERMTMSMQSEILSLSVKSYFAVTSNTAQFGINAEIDFKIVVRVKGEIGFDTIFQFNPFHFIADARGSVSLSIRSWEIMGVSLLLHVDGPNPWNAHGSISYHLGPFKDTQTIKRTWGGTAPAVIAPSVAVAPLVNEALNNDRNWRVEMPKRFQLKVGLKELPPGANVILPNGYITVSQLVAPLALKIQTYGQQNVSDSGFYDITDMKIVDWASPPAVLANLSSNVRPVFDDFAPAQYLKMSDNDKLRAKSFESLKSGVKCTVNDEAEWVTSPVLGMPTQTIRLRTMHYDKITIDKKLRRPLNGTLHKFLSANFVNGGVVSNNPVINKGALIDNRPVAYVSGRQERLIVRTANSLASITSIGSTTVPSDFGSRAEARSFINGLDSLTASGIVILPII